MIDASLNVPFYSRDKHGRIKTDDMEQFYWYSSLNPVFQIENQVLCKIFQNKEIQVEFDNLRRMDFSYFEKNFWSHEKKNKNCSNLTALIVWTELISHIKGSAISHRNQNWHLSKNEYKDYVGMAKTFISKELKDEIWDICQKYEKWKMKEKMFDQMDVISYMINEIRAVNQKFFFKKIFFRKIN